MIYPNLRSGVAVQYPLRRRTRHHIVSSRTPGGYVSRIRGGSEPEVGWTLRYENLTDAEAQALEDLFTATGGGLESFTFVDPMANLLAWSEDLSAGAWLKTGLLVEPFTERGLNCFRLTNAGQGTAWLEQLLPLPGGRICMSCEARWAPGGWVYVNAGVGDAMNLLGTNWQLRWATGQAAAGGTSMCGVGVPAGGGVEVRRLQAEVQAIPSAYKTSYERSGIYSSARFDMNGLKIVADGPDRNRAVVRVRARLGSAL